MTILLYDNPLYTLEDRLEIAKGTISFQEKVIENLREQIKNLKTLTSEIDSSVVDGVQYRHIHVTPSHETMLSSIDSVKSSVFYDKTVYKDEL